MKKLIALLLVFSILSLSGNLYAEKKGADLIILKIDGTQVRGELIAVKKNSLLILERYSGSDVSVGIMDIQGIIIKKSKPLLGASLGFLTGVGVGALGTEIGWDFLSWAPNDTKTKYRIMAWIGVICGLLGALIGKAIADDSETFTFEGKSDLEINRTLEYLRENARIPELWTLNNY
jgi:hypothetical protein